MIEVNARLIFLVGFLAAVALYVWTDKKLERHSILFIRRTKRGIKSIDNIAKRFPRFWNYYGWAGVFTGIISVFAALAMLLYTFYDMAVRQSAQNGPSLILPGIVPETTFQPGASFVPAEYWVISIIVMMTVHELSHGIVARAEDIELNSVGWVIVGILPLGAFVEPEGEKMLPDDKEEDNKEESKEESQATWDVGNWKSRLKVLCAGSFANYIIALLFFLIATGFTAGLTYEETTGYMGINLGENNSEIVYQAQKGYPAYQSGMRNGTILRIENRTIESAEDMLTVSRNLEPNQTIEVETSEGNFTFKTVENQVSRLKPEYETYSSVTEWFISMLTTVAFLNFLIGLFNMAPIKPLDGGLVLETFISEFVGEDGIANVNKFSLAMWALLLLSLLLGLSASFL